MWKIESMIRAASRAEAKRRTWKMYKSKWEEKGKMWSTTTQALGRWGMATCWWWCEMKWKRWLQWEKNEKKKCWLKYLRCYHHELNEKLAIIWLHRHCWLNGEFDWLRTVDSVNYYMLRIENSCMWKRCECNTNKERTLSTTTIGFLCTQSGSPSTPFFPHSACAMCKKLLFFSFSCSVAFSKRVMILMSLHILRVIVILFETMKWNRKKRNESSRQSWQVGRATRADFSERQSTSTLFLYMLSLPASTRAVVIINIMLIQVYGVLFTILLFHAPRRPKWIIKIKVWAA